MQSMLRHANPSITLGIYTHAVDKKKRSAQSKIVQMVLPEASSQRRRWSVGKKNES